MTPTISGRKSAIRTVGSSVPARGRSRRRTRNSNGRASLRFRISTGGSASGRRRELVEHELAAARRVRARDAARAHGRAVSSRRSTNARPVAPACATASSCSMSPRSRRRAARHAAVRGASSARSSICARSSSAGISRRRLSIAVTAPAERETLVARRQGHGPDALAAEHRLHLLGRGPRNRRSRTRSRRGRPAPPRARSDRRARSAEPRAGRRRPSRPPC